MERQYKDIEFRKLKQQEMKSYKQYLEREQIDQMFKPKILNKSKMMYLKRAQQEQKVFERLSRKSNTPQRSVSIASINSKSKSKSKSPLKSVKSSLTEE